MKAKDGSITIKDNEINVQISTEVGNNLQLKEDGLFVPVEGNIGITFTTDIAVGHLPAGTQIRATDRISDIIYRMLYSPTQDMVNFYYGASDNLPTSTEGLTAVEKRVDDILARRVTQVVVTGDEQTLEGQYPVFAIDKRTSDRNIVLTQLSVRGAESIPLDFITVEGDNDFVYYIATKTYDADLGGTEYILTFEEENN